MDDPPATANIKNKVAQLMEYTPSVMTIETHTAVQWKQSINFPSFNLYSNNLIFVIKSKGPASKQMKDVTRHTARIDMISHIH
jgi:hypothetical protein